jgi:hypothetical protein
MAMSSLYSVVETDVPAMSTIPLVVIANMVMLRSDPGGTPFFEVKCKKKHCQTKK